MDLSINEFLSGAMVKFSISDLCPEFVNDTVKETSESPVDVMTVTTTVPSGYYWHKVFSVLYYRFSVECFFHCKKSNMV